MKKRTYEMKDEISHVLDLPDMYIGSTRLNSIEDFCAIKDEKNEYKIIRKQLTFPPALIRIFIEIISNAIDNVERSKNTNTPCKTIRINVNQETGETSVWNDGEVISIELSKISINGETLYNHSLIFGHLRTSGNYDKTEDKVVSGRFGVGSNVCNIFSKKFTVEGVDSINQKMLTQTWTDNMRNTTKPIITNSKAKKGYTKVSYFPDFSRFGMSGYTDDIMHIYAKYAIDTSMLTKVKVFFNDELIKVSNFLSYANLYSELELSKKDTLYIQTENSEVLVAPSDIFQAISFVNGIYTRDGGTHVDAFVEALFRPIVKKINDKGKGKVSIVDVKAHFRLFVVSSVINPEFSSQEKVLLLHPKIEVSIEKKDIDKLLKWESIKNIENILSMKNNLVLKNIEKKSKNVFIDALENANYAGTNKGYLCSLVLTEGLSACSFGIVGCETGVYEVKGRNYFGYYALRGKVLNIRNNSQETIVKNKVITDLIQSIGLRQGVDYTDDENWKKLRYGRVIILADADVDGLAIASLLLNFFHVLFPSVLKRTPSYVVSMATPIVRVKDILLFYDEYRYREYAKTKSSEWLKKHSQYYKGLGTSTEKDARELFGKKMIEFTFDEKTDETMEKVFNKKNADLRKNWLEVYDPNKPKNFSIDDAEQFTSMSITDFLENETITFSWSDCCRSIPHLIDGQKVSQRKLLFSMKKANLSYNKPPMKVAQVGAFCAKETSYHHGEQSLFETIVKMAQNFTGSNNIPLFDRKGNFGSRYRNGDDSAQPRYIFTRKEELTDLIFRKEDDPLLDYINEDGDEVEPKFYVPIIPMILINGSLGIGTGWSCFVPCYNPTEIISILRTVIQAHEQKKFDVVNENSYNIIPWYRGFIGNIVRDGNKFISWGKISRIKENMVVVSEIPIGMSIDDLRLSLEELLKEKKIAKLRNESTINSPNFIITEAKDGIICSLETLKLYKYIHVSNMVLFDTKGRLHKFSIKSIIEEYYVIRFHYYVLRKKYILSKLKEQLKILQNKLRFIQQNISEEINIRNMKEIEVIYILEKKSFDKLDNSYSYLLDLPMKYLTEDYKKKLQKEVADNKKEIENIENTTEYKMWLDELNELEINYKKWLDRINKEK